MSNERWSKRDIVFALYETKGIGMHTMAKVADCVPPDRAASLTVREWRELGLSAAQAAGAQRMFGGEIVRRRALYEAAGIAWITRCDPEYPERLAEMPDAPWVLYAKGRLELLRDYAVAIVGTRLPSAYGRQTATAFAERLSASGLTIVSGLARGIDSLAHEGGLRGVGSTIAVLGTPIGIVYPPQNGSLYRAIAERGLLLSEYPLGTKRHPGLFSQRNRIIAALGYGTIVVEAAQQSGSLITAKYATEYNREVYAVPGQVGTPKSEGTNELISAGKAKLIMSPQQVLEDLLAAHSDQLLPGARRVVRWQGPSADGDGLSDEERAIMELLQDGALTSDELAVRSGLSFGHLHAVLINLSVKRKIEQHPGSLYSALRRF